MEREAFPSNLRPFQKNIKNKTNKTNKNLEGLLMVHFSEECYEF